jgi:ComF family protein
MLRRCLDLLLPPSCVLCGLSDEQAPLCARCRDVLPRNDVACRRCAAPLDVLYPGADCGACQSNPPAYHAARAPLRYAFPVDAALKRLKFRQQLLFAPVFAGLLVPVLNHAFPDCDALVPVPLHRRRHVLRGFNQADEICRPLTGASGLPTVMNVDRCRATPPQSGLSALERRRNLRNAFAVRGDLPARYPLIIDDVLTTGSTCNELAKALLGAGAERVGVLVVARASTSAGHQAGSGVSTNV